MFNLDNDASRQLSDAEVEVLKREVPQLNDAGTAAYYTDRLECVNNKP